MSPKRPARVPPPEPVAAGPCNHGIMGVLKSPRDPSALIIGLYWKYFGL